MPDTKPPGWISSIPIIGGVADAASSILSPIVGAISNKRNRKLALRDRDYENWYNSPAQQMARYKEAGLNPNLIYGNAGNMQSASVNMGARETPQIDPGKGIASFQDFLMKQMDMDKTRELIETQNKAQLIQDETLLNIRQKTKNLGLDYFQKESLFESQAEMLKEKVRGQQLSNRLAFQKHEINELMKAPNLEKLLADIQMTRAKKSLIPYQRDLLVAQAKNIGSSTSLNEVRRLSQEKQNSIFNDAHTLLLEQITTEREKHTMQSLEQDRQRIQNRWKDMGLSETATSDIIETITGAKILKGIGDKMSGAKQLPDQRNRVNKYPGNYNKWGTKTSKGGYNLE